MDEHLLPRDRRQAFLDYNLNFRVANFKVGCLLVVGLMPVGALLDWVAYPEKLGFFFVLRLICSLIALGLWGLLQTSFGRRQFLILGMICFVLPALFISLMIYFADGVSSSYYSGLNLVLIGMTWAAQVDFLESVIASSLTIAMYCIACFAHGPVSGTLLFNHLYFISLTGVIVVTGSYYVNRLRFREFALRAELDFSRKELETSNLKLVEMDRAKSEFFANISHELRTPLTLLIGPLERLRTDLDSRSPAGHAELLDIMYGNALRLLRLINDLLSLVRLDSGALVLRKEKIQLKSFLEGLAQSVSPMAQQCQLSFESKIAIPEEDAASLDRDKVEKIVYNLLFNAFKFTPPQGFVSLSAHRRENQLEIAVSDSGKGISPADLEKIFDRFWQAEGSTTRRYQGVGIGLALVKELAMAHGGKAFAQSEPGRGTTMTIELDVSPEPVTEGHQLESPVNEDGVAWLNGLYRRAELFPAHVPTNRIDAPREAKLDDHTPQILIVDDEPDMRRFLASQLARGRDFSLILLDFMMPDMDGVEVMHQLRKLPTTKTTPIIILTARMDEDFKIRTLQAGATDFLTKPFSSTELMVRAGNIVSVYQLQKQLVRKTEQLEEALEEIKETESQLVHQAKMASLGQLSAGLMHEINNPLNFANTAFHLLKKRLVASPVGDQPTLTKPLNDIQDGIKRVVAITSSLRNFTHPDDSTFGPVDLFEVVTSSVLFVQIDRERISLQLEVPQPLQIWGNSNQLVHLFINLLQNSIDSLHEKDSPKKEIRIQAEVEGEKVAISLYDNGKGIAPADLTKIYDAFFTTKKVGSGVGLGLNTCHRIVEQHHGRITVESQLNEFCRFHLILPRSQILSAL
jgi:signal transduction histidine kinase